MCPGRFAEVAVDDDIRFETGDSNVELAVSARVAQSGVRELSEQQQGQQHGLSIAVMRPPDISRSVRNVSHFTDLSHSGYRSSPPGPRPQSTRPLGSTTGRR